MVISTGFIYKGELSKVNGMANCPSIYNRKKATKKQTNKNKIKKHSIVWQY
jgi:hypothetical protein